MRNLVLRTLLRSEKTHKYLKQNFSYKKLAFLHIPKCGGTSIAHAISEAICVEHDGYINPIHTRNLAQLLVGSEQKLEEIELLFNIRKTLFFDYFKKGNSYIYGHFPIVKQCLLEPEDYVFVTLLREPIERFISHFRYHVATRELRDKSFVTDSDIEILWTDYVSSEIAKLHSNTLTAYLDEKSLCSLGKPDSLDRAIENLQYFGVVGLLEDLDSFSRKFNSKLKTNLYIKDVKNRTSDKISQDQNTLIKKFFTDKIYDQISQLCSQDITLYNFAKSLLK